MTILKTVLAFSLAVAALPAALANHVTSTGFLDRDQQYQTSTSQKSRAEVKAELSQSKASKEPNNTASLRVDPQSNRSAHGYNFQNGSLVHTDKISHDTPKPSVSMTNAEKQRLERVYGGGRG